MPILLKSSLLLRTPDAAISEEMEKWFLNNNINFYKTDKGFQVVGMGLDKISIPSNM